jgi:hypothetical protein
MSIDANLVKKFEDILSRELMAFKLYNSVISQVKDEFFIARLTEIRDDEAKHIKLAQAMLNLLKQ